MRWLSLTVFLALSLPVFADPAPDSSTAKAAPSVPDCKGPVKLLGAKAIFLSFVKSPVRTIWRAVPQTYRGLRDAVRLFRAAEAQTVDDILVQLSGVENRRGSYMELAKTYDEMLNEYEGYRRTKASNNQAKIIQAQRISRLEEAYAANKDTKNKNIGVSLPYAPSDEGTYALVQDTELWSHARFKDASDIKGQIKRERDFLNRIVDKYELDLNLTQALMRWHLLRFQHYLSKTSQAKLQEMLKQEEATATNATSEVAQRALREKREESDTADRLARRTVELLADTDLMASDWAVTYVENTLNGSFHWFYTVTYPLVHGTGRVAIWVWHGIERVGAAARWVGKPFATAAAVTALAAAGLGAWATATGHLQPYWDRWTKTPEQIAWRDHVAFMQSLKTIIADPAESYEDFEKNFYAYFQPKSSDDAIKIAMDYLHKRTQGLEAPKGKEGLSKEAQRLIEIQNILITGYDSYGNRYFRGAQERLELRRQNSTDMKNFGQAADRGEVKFPLEIPKGLKPVLPNKPAEPAKK